MEAKRALGQICTQGHLRDLAVALSSVPSPGRDTIVVWEWETVEGWVVGRTLLWLRLRQGVKRQGWGWDRVARASEGRAPAPTPTNHLH